MIIKQNLFEHLFVFLLGEWGQLMNLAFQPLATQYIRKYCLFAKAASSAMQVRNQYPTSGQTTLRN